MHTPDSNDTTIPNSAPTARLKGDVLLKVLAAAYRSAAVSDGGVRLNDGGLQNERLIDGRLQNKLMAAMACVKPDSLVGATILAALADQVEGWGGEEWGCERANAMQAQIHYSVLTALLKATGLTTDDCLGEDLGDPFDW